MKKDCSLIFDIKKYLNFLSENKKKITFFVLKNGDVDFSSDVFDMLNELGCKATAVTGSAWSYYSYEGKLEGTVIINETSVDTDLLTTADFSVKINACKSKIFVSGKNYCLNNKGLNIVVFDKKTNSLCDTVTFISNNAIREEIENEELLKINQEIKFLQSEIVHLSDALNETDTRMKATICAIIKQSTTFSEYINALIAFKKYITIAISVRDTSGFVMTSVENGLLRDLGLKTNFNGKHWHPYVALVDRGNVAFEKLGEYCGELHEKVTINSTAINLSSCPYKNGDLSSIKVNNIEYSLNRRGFNICVFDSDTLKEIDRASFDFLDNPVVSSKDTKKDYTQQFNATLNNLNEKVDLIKFKTLINHYLLWSLNGDGGLSTKQTKEKVFKNLPYLNNTIRSFQHVCVLTLKKIHELCSANKINYWLCFGGLIGYVRHGACIPWDDDLDICMLREDFNKFCKVVKDDPVLKLHIYFSVTNVDFFKVYKVYLDNSPIFVDIFVYDEIKSPFDSPNNYYFNFKNALKNEAYELLKNKGINVSSRETRLEVDDPCFGDVCKIFDKYTANSVGSGKEKYLMWGVDNFAFHRVLNGHFYYDEVFPLKKVHFENIDICIPCSPDTILEKVYGDIYNFPEDIENHSHFSAKAFEMAREIEDKFDKNKSLLKK